MISDPHLDYVFDEPLADCEAIGNMIHQIICGKPPIQIPDYKRQLHLSVKNSPYFNLIKYYFDLADGLISPPSQP